jgi:diacylglycerol kinase family enzyme
MSLELPGQEPVEGLAFVIVQNTSPWTFLGPLAINPCPRASFDLGLDVFAPHSLGTVSTVRYGLRMLRGSRGGGVAGQLTLLHDAAAFTVRASPPASLQVDGDAMGRVGAVWFSSRSGALRIVG